ncbi:MAG: 2-hydroxyacyl-CoA dehydratase family protein [Deltaproteobacteria bacterium]|jgi:benzoyl-CoA reductase/2-hydroxyglutaryl-CoA dehydratase subunit BcrC/BadD/HgdB|nr:2-hydroxyacyl-CoA dehydratase family protein [Deltaproteobacteria bacterium]
MTAADRREKTAAQTRAQTAAEIARAADELRGRPGYPAGLDYFLDLLASPESGVAARTGRPAAALLCLQAPLELVHAHGLQPYKIFGAGQAASRLAAPSLPAVMCPLLRSAAGAAASAEAGPDFAAWILPTTCDWAVKFAGMAELCGFQIKAPVHRLELPHLKDADGSQNRWREEVYSLASFLKKVTGLRKFPLRELRRSMVLYQRANMALAELCGLKRRGLAAPIYAQVICHSFFRDKVETWTRKVGEVLPGLEKSARENSPGKTAGVYLAGSPIFFPNLKIFSLLEEAGLNPAVDDLCSSERLLPGAIPYEDGTEASLLKALAQRYHQGCACPTFEDNDRRINNILGPAQRKHVRGVVYHVLKGCHPFDLESLALEGRIKDAGLRYLRLETDYAPEDSRAILTRLEAFRTSLG